MIKTNPMRILDSKKIKYKVYDYSATPFTDGKEVADCLKEDYSICFKTIVTKGKSNQHYVFMLPVDKELDLKKCAKAVDEKNIELIHLKELFSLTGYVHGGCSPLGMKKEFKTVIDESILDKNVIIFSGGKIGYQIEISLLDLKDKFNFTFFNITL